MVYYLVESKVAGVYEDFSGATNRLRIRTPVPNGEGGGTLTQNSLEKMLHSVMFCLPGQICLGKGQAGLDTLLILGSFIGFL